MTHFTNDVYDASANAYIQTLETAKETQDADSDRFLTFRWAIFATIPKLGEELPEDEW